MQFENHSTKEKEETAVWIPIPKNRLLRPFPLIWGIASFVLFSAFVAITMVQFREVSEENVYQTKVDAYVASEQAYKLAEQARMNCLNSVETRATYRSLFDSISELFERTASLPAEILPESEEADTYRAAMLKDIQTLIMKPVDEKLQVLYADDCENLPAERPVPPTR